MKRDMICISCPLGCHLSVTLDGGQVTDVEGNLCKRGIQYAEDECLNPMRFLTTTVKVQGSSVPLAVRSSAVVPKAELMRAVEQLKKITVNPPVRVGDILFSDFLGLNADIIATQNSG